MAFNAWQTWTARNNFNALTDSSTPKAIGQVETVVQMAIDSDTMTQPNLIPLKQTGLSVQDSQWRVLFDDQYAYLINLHSLFGRRKRPVKIVVLERRTLSFEITGEKWIGKAQKLKLVINGEPADSNYEASPEALDKLRLIAPAGTILAANAE